MKKKNNSITVSKIKKEPEKTLDYKIIKTISEVSEIKKITDTLKNPTCQYNTITRI